VALRPFRLEEKSRCRRNRTISSTKNRVKYDTNSVSSKKIRRRKTVTLATASVYAAMYVALVYLFSPISYGQMQFRVANVIVGLIPLLGWAGIIGQTIGVLVANMNSPLGPIDLLNAIPTFVLSFLIWKLRRISVFLGLTLYSLALGLSVSFALNYAFGLPLLVSIPYVTAGIFIATTVAGYILYRAVNKLGIVPIIR
jgi:uncharacterized membrane protein